MKKIVVLFITFVLLIGIAFADTITLNTPETLSSPTAAKIGSWEVIRLNANYKVMIVRYRWVDSQGKVIGGLPGSSGNGWLQWRCEDIEVPGTNAECTDVGVPYECCTGAGTGTCDDMESTCFSDVFGFSIRAQDVGTSIGAGLRALIWNKMKEDILTTGNDGSFD